MLIHRCHATLRLGPWFGRRKFKCTGGHKEINIDFAFNYLNKRGALLSIIYEVPKILRSLDLLVHDLSSFNIHVVNLRHALYNVDPTSVSFGSNLPGFAAKTYMILNLGTQRPAARERSLSFLSPTAHGWEASHFVEFYAAPMHGQLIHRNATFRRHFPPNAVVSMGRHVPSHACQGQFERILQPLQRLAKRCVCRHLINREPILDTQHHLHVLSR